MNRSQRELGREASVRIKGKKSLIVSGKPKSEAVSLNLCLQPQEDVRNVSFAYR